eukprot:TRINITY_DN26593_c0_g1_i1.p1 TRINITY_DN26593_c0_g1~~TRINITY_DN26593_c0_g1_i1.p1  ORF type:complete len:335 (+),score=103.46 TRINITY_DN26593_c0_g1_i1:124-1128(+)
MLRDAVKYITSCKALSSALVSLGQIGMMLVGIFCVAAANGLILVLSFIWFSKLLPALLDIDTKEGFVQFMLSSWFTFNALFFHYHAATVPPGGPVNESLPPICPSDQDMKRQRGEQWARFCKTCWAWKPPRAHHCHFCGTCVLKMDHHCPWINGCVGHFNQKFFMNMLIYIWLATAQVSVLILLYFGGFLRPVADKNKLIALNSLFTTELLLCGTLWLMMTFFLVWNGFLVVTNQTVIEFYGNMQSSKDARLAGRQWQSPFDLGWWKNLQEVYGAHPTITSMLIPSWSKVTTDGHVYKTVFGPAKVTNPTGRRQVDDYDSDSDLMPVPPAGVTP